MRGAVCIYIEAPRDTQKPRGNEDEMAKREREWE